MVALKIFLLALAIYSLVSIVIPLVQMAIVIKNKGKVNSDGIYFTIHSMTLSLCTATLIVIW